MTAAALLNHLRHEGYTLRTDGEKVYLGPRERVTPEVCDQVLAVKPDLLQLLADEWNGEKALELLAATMRRLGPQCPPDIPPALLGHLDVADSMVQDAFDIRDMKALRHALALYEARAEEVFRSWIPNQRGRRR